MRALNLTPLLSAFGVECSAMKKADKNINYLTLKNVRAFLDKTNISVLIICKKCDYTIYTKFPVYFETLYQFFQVVLYNQLFAHLFGVSFCQNPHTFLL